MKCAAPRRHRRRRRGCWRCCRCSACRRSTTRSSTWCCTGSCWRPRGTSCRATPATSRSATARSSAPACTRRPRWLAQLRLAVPVDAAGGGGWSPRCSASALGAVVFRVQGRARRAVRAAHAGGHLRARHHRRQHADRRRPGRLLTAVPVPKIGPTPSSTFYLLALAAAAATLLIAWAHPRCRASAPACSRSTTTRTRPR